MKTPKIVTMGYAAMDYLHRVERYPKRGEKMRITESIRACGGQCATAAIALKFWGSAVRFVGKIGDDEQGEFVRNALVSAGLDADSILTVSGCGTQHAEIIVDAETGERTIFWDRSHKLDLKITDLKREWFDAVDLLLVDGHEIEADIQAASWVRDSGGTVILDAEEPDAVNPDLIPLVNIAIASSDFGSKTYHIDDPRKVIGKLRALGVAIAGVTLGNQGVIADWGAGLMRFPAIPVQAVDTTGAGDIFHAGIVFGMSCGWQIHDTFQYANTAAGLSCQYLGGQHGIAPRETIEDYLQS
jgi:sulfofructose kinase